MLKHINTNCFLYFQCNLLQSEEDKKNKKSDHKQKALTDPFFIEALNQNANKAKYINSKTFNRRNDHIFDAL